MAILIAIGITARRVVLFAAAWSVVGAIAHQTGAAFVANFLVADNAPMLPAG